VSAPERTKPLTFSLPADETVANSRHHTIGKVKPVPTYQFRVDLWRNGAFRNTWPASEPLPVSELHDELSRIVATFDHPTVDSYVYTEPTNLPGATIGFTDNDGLHFTARVYVRTLAR
jgi:hypothetical protein